MRVALLALAFLTITATVTAQLQPGNLLLASNESHGGSYVLDRYDASGAFLGRVHEGQAAPFVFQAKAMYAPSRERIYFAENDHVLRRVGANGVPAERIGGEHVWISGMTGDAAGNLYVGDSYGNDSGEVLKYDANGSLIDRYPVHVSFSMDLAADQCTLLYAHYNWRFQGGDWFKTWLSIDRYDVCRHQPLEPFLARLDHEGISILQLRILPGGGILLLSDYAISRFDARGAVVWRRSFDNVNSFFLSLSVTPSTFWLTTADDKLRRFRTATGEEIAEPAPLHSQRVTLAGSVIGAWQAALAREREDVIAPRASAPQ